MPRPFAVTGFTMFAVMILLYELGIGSVPYFAALFAAGLVFTLSIKSAREQRVLPAAFAVALACCGLFAAKWSFSYAPALELDGKTACVECSVTDYGEESYGRYRYVCDIDTVDGRKFEGKIKLSFSVPLEAELYDRVSGEFRIYAIGSDNESREFIRSTGCYIGGYPTDYTGENVEIISVAESSKGLNYKLALLRERICDTLTGLIPGETGNFACSVLLGGSDRLSDKTSAEFSAAGISHLVCVSGLHLSVWAGVIIWLFRRFRLNSKLAGVISLVFVIGYMALTGFMPSVCRAGIMMLLYLVSVIISRNRDSINSLGFASCVLLCINPFYAGSAGFRLTFLATAGILVLFPLIFERSKKLTGKLSKYPAAAVNFVLSSVCTVLSVSVFALPVTLPLYGSFTLLSLPANLLVLPFASVSMISAGAAALFSFVEFLFPLKYAAAYVCLLSSKFVLNTAHRLAEIHWLTFYPDKNLSAIWLCGAFLILSVAFIFSLKNKKAFKAAAFVLAVSFVSLTALSFVGSNMYLKLSVLDCGNAGCILLRKGGKTAVISCGRDDEFFGSTAEKNIFYRNVVSIDTLLLPSENERENGCAGRLLSQTEVGSLVCTSLPYGTGPLTDNVSVTEYKNEYSGEILPDCKYYTLCTDSCAFTYIETPGADVLILHSPGSVLSEIPAAYLDADILVSRQSVPVELYAHAYGAVIISGDEGSIEQQNELLSYGVNCASTSGCGDITARINFNGKYDIVRE